MTDLSDIPAIILCGGRGTRMERETEFLPKPMLRVGGRPMLWHIMQGYAAWGVRRFILCLGFKGGLIKEYFVNYRCHEMSMRLSLASGNIEWLEGAADVPDWEITLADTGEDTLTGKRVEHAFSYLDAPFAFVTYGDGVANVDINALVKHHTSSERLATVTGVRPSSRFGELDIDGEAVTSFSEKPQVGGGWINGGFMILSRESMAKADWERDESLEVGLLQPLAEASELTVYRHGGFWQCMDTVREHALLNELYASGSPPWIIHP